MAAIMAPLSEYRVRASQEGKSVRVSVGREHSELVAAQLTPSEAMVLSRSLAVQARRAAPLRFLVGRLVEELGVVLLVTLAMFAVFAMIVG